MKILYVSHYFPPEMGAPAGRVAGLSREWARAGHEVHVLTGFPHHPTGKIHPDYRRAFRRGFLRERVDGYDVHRTWIFPAANRGKIRRSLNYASFMASAALVGSLRIRRPDVVVATSPQLLCAVAGHLLARRFRCPMVMEVRDLWPESLVAVGASRHSSPLVTGLERLACGLYRRASHVVTITEAQRAAIVADGVPAAQVSVIPNGVDAAFLEPAAARCTDGQFVVTYIGTLGMAHKLETLLEAAKLLRGDARIEFRIVGEGARREALEARTKELGLTNVHFAGERPRDEVPRWIAESDACAVLLRRTDVFLTVVPSKMLEIMAVGRPIILGVDGEARALLERACAGLVIQPESAEQLAAAIRRLQGEPALARQLGENGREFVRREFRRESLAARYLELLERVRAEVASDPSAPLGAGEWRVRRKSEIRNQKSES
ncbi:MAG: glycosyltransferase family 4 protein [Acidobacteria bacterium]|nr:glycosyltransferase family 4 protein [Acidobacteriota bacterium]